MIILFRPTRTRQASIERARGLIQPLCIFSNLTYSSQPELRRLAELDRRLTQMAEQPVQPLGRDALARVLAACRQEQGLE